MSKTISKSFGSLVLMGIFFLSFFVAVGSVSAQQDEEGMDSWVAGQHVPGDIPGIFVDQEKTTVENQEVWEFTVEDEETGTTTIVDIDVHSGDVVNQYEQGQNKEDKASEDEESNNQQSNEDENKEAVPAHDGDNDSKGGEGDTEKGGKLPNTATSTFNWILIGSLSFLVGIAGLFITRKRKATASSR